jgi:hypothetical protein
MIGAAKNIGLALVCFVTLILSYAIAAPLGLLFLACDTLGQGAKWVGIWIIDRADEAARSLMGRMD